MEASQAKARAMEDKILLMAFKSCDTVLIAGVTKSFIDARLAYTLLDGIQTFKAYSDTTKSITMKIPPAGTVLKYLRELLR